MTMPPLAADPENSRPDFRRLRELAAEHGLAELSMGTSQDYRVAAEEGATLVRVGVDDLRGRRRANTPAVMGFSDLWNRTLVYFGIAEDEEWDDDQLADERAAARGELPPS